VSAMIWTNDPPARWVCTINNNNETVQLLSVCLSVYHLSIYLSFCLSVCLSVCLTVDLVTKKDCVAPPVPKVFRFRPSWTKTLLKILDSGLVPFLEQAPTLKK
jgi:hypothetical protein